jgi:hypothetical protein
VLAALTAVDWNMTTDLMMRRIAAMLPQLTGVITRMKSRRQRSNRPAPPLLWRAN